MLKKTLMAMAIAGAFGFSAGALANSNLMHGNTVSALTPAEGSTPMMEIGDGILAAAGDDDLATMAAWNDDPAVGATSSAAGGEVGFASDGTSIARTGGLVSDANATVDEVYLVPAPLARNGGSLYWKLELTPAVGIAQADRLATENVYVMRPVEDAIVDPVAALSEGPDAITSRLSDQLG